MQCAESANMSHDTEPHIVLQRSTTWRMGLGMRCARGRIERVQTNLNFLVKRKCQAHFQCERERKQHAQNCERMWCVIADGAIGHCDVKNVPQPIPDRPRRRQIQTKRRIQQEPNIYDRLKCRVIAVPTESHTTDWAETWADEGQYSTRKGQGHKKHGGIDGRCAFSVCSY